MFIPIVWKKPGLTILNQACGWSLGVRGDGRPESRT
jgi:hypothetical protein